jgi:DNA-binding transcriptional ArsR family regulator
LPQRRKRDFIDQNLVKALAHPLRVEVLDALNEQTASPNMLEDQLGVPLGNISYHVNVLLECGCVELVYTEPRRGAVEHFYRALPRSFVGHQSWRKVPRSLRGSISVGALKSFFDKAVAAMKEGKVDGREDTTLTWFTVSVDEVGWAQVVKIMKTALTQLQTVDEQSRKRVTATGGALTPIVIGLAAFEAARRRGGKGG